MPRYVDGSKRRQQIVDACFEILATRGASGLTLRSVADVLGGSTSLVTHFYPTRDRLLRGIGEQMLELYAAQLEELESCVNAEERLEKLMIWMLPIRDEDWKFERVRATLLDDRERDPELASIFTAVREQMFALLYQHLEPLLPPDQIPGVADILRSVTNGLVLSSLEQKAEWPAERQIAVVSAILEALGLTHVHSD
jgi:AcrR family transcriptional regulator